jgi:hypothetical protein
MPEFHDNEQEERLDNKGYNRKEKRWVIGEKASVPVHLMFYITKYWSWLLCKEKRFICLTVLETESPHLLGLL